MQEFFAAIFLLLLGGCMGSFASMLIYRLPSNNQQLNIWRPPSFCPTCKSKLAITQLIPFLSFIFFRGKCKACNNKIDSSYLLNEVVIAGLLIFLVSSFGASSILTWIIFASFFILYVQAMMDLNTLLLYQHLSVLLIISGLTLNIGFELFTIPLDAILGLIFGYGILFSVNLLHKMIRATDGIGSGDFLLLGGIGSMFGASSIGPILLIGSTITLLVFFIRRDSKNIQLPLGFGLGLGSLIYSIILISIQLA